MPFWRIFTRNESTERFSSGEHMKRGSSPSTPEPAVLGQLFTVAGKVFSAKTWSPPPRWHRIW